MRASEGVRPTSLELLEQASFKGILDVQSDYLCEVVLNGVKK